MVNLKEARHRCGAIEHNRTLSEFIELSSGLDSSAINRYLIDLAEIEGTSTPPPACVPEGS